jgi:hypothetical protein
MRTTLLRIALPILVLAAGLAFLVIGAEFHRTPVEEEKTRTITVAIATPYDSADGQSPSDQEGPDKGVEPHDMPAKAGDADDGNPFETPAVEKDRAKRGENPFAPAEPVTSLFDKIPPQGPAAVGSDAPLPAGMLRKDIEEKYLAVQDEPERVLVREITIGGVTRLANGQLKRTYSGKPPLLCPS